MSRKQVSDISVKNAMGEFVKTIGVVSADERFVVGCVGRMNPKPVWKEKTNEETGNVTRSRISMRIDANVSLWDNEKGQGAVVIPYLSCRTIEIEGGFGSMIRFGTPFDNDNDRKQYKNALISEDLWETMQEALGAAADACINAAEKGEVSAISANKHISDPKRLSKITDMLMQKAETAAKLKPAVKSKGTVQNADKVKNILFANEGMEESKQ